MKFVRQMTARIVHIKANKQLEEEMLAKKGQLLKVWRNVVDTNSPPQLANIAKETAMKTLMRTLLSL